MAQPMIAENEIEQNPQEAPPVVITLKISQDDMQALALIRNYFYDKTHLHYLAYNVLNRLVEQVDGPTNTCCVRMPAQHYLQNTQ